MSDVQYKDLLLQHLAEEGVLSAEQAAEIVDTARETGRKCMVAFVSRYNAEAVARYQVQLPMVGDGLYSKPETWQMIYGITGANDSGIYDSGNLYKPGVMTGTAPVVVKYENGNPPYNTDWNNVAPSIGARKRRSRGSRAVTPRPPSSAPWPPWCTTRSVANIR